MESINVPEAPLHEYWRDIYQRRLLIALTAVLSAIAAIVFGNFVTPVFESKTTFFLAANSVPPNFVGRNPDIPPSPLFPIPEEKAASLDVGILRGREIMLQLSDQFEIPLGELNRRVDITVSGEFMIDVFARHEDPTLAADIANALPVLYASFHENSMAKRANQIANALTKRLDTLFAQSATLEASRLQAQKNSVTTADSAALERLAQQRDQTTSELAGLDAQLSQMSARVGSLQDALEREVQFFSDSKTLETTRAFDAMLERVLELRVELSKVTFSTDSPRRKSIVDQIGQIEKSMESERKRMVSAAAKPRGSLHEEVRLELVTARATLAGLQAARSASQQRMDAAKMRFESLLGAAATTENISIQLQRIETQIASTEDNLSSALLQVENIQAPLVIVERASIQTRPIFPLTTLNAIVAAICGLILGAYYALFIAHAERVRQLRRVVLAELPLFTESELDQLRKADTLRINHSNQNKKNEEPVFART